MPDAAVVVKAPDPTPLATCTDGGALAGAAANANEFRFCLDDDKKTRSCWALAIATGTISGFDKHDALDGLDRLEMERDYDAIPKPTTWSAKVAGETVEVCGPDGCKPFAVVPAKNPDDDSGAVEDAAVSASGKHVAVVRGLSMIAHNTIEIYDRASGKRLGVARPPSMCVSMQGFANETVVAAEWDCANQGGDRILIAPTGKIIGRIARLSTGGDPFAQLEGDRWAFSEMHTASIEIYDVATGKRLGGREVAQFANFAVHGGRAFVLEPNTARVYVFDKDGKEIAKARVPTCRYEWETESIGPVRLLMPVAELAKAIGGPTKKSKPDEVNMHTATWTYANGVTAIVRPNYVSDATGEPVPPWLVVGFTLAAPSKHQIKGVGIGSSLDDLKKAFGPNEVKSATSDTKFVAGNDSEGDGIVFTLAGGKVTRIEMGEVATE